MLRLHPEPLFSLQPYRMTRTFRLPLDEDTEALVADEEILHIGVDFVTVQVPRAARTRGTRSLTCGGGRWLCSGNSAVSRRNSSAYRAGRTGAGG